uniref:Albumin-1 n=1 Tax=Psophocarpus tetragonolobus TaxID=3891 RepID=ALB1_PSOTE|nr:RecName: Full=Albumin-1; AltName: Full=WBA-1 [Psophocarpus tetragonolobus]1WBA_A Chain A, WINGED BEAN ALBUMIN 1 [Psophocarpus tetragonolobus]
ADDPVYDAEGNKLVNRGKYTIVSFSDGAGIDVVATGNENPEDPLSIVKSTRNIMYATSISSEDKTPPQPRNILENMRLKINFATDPHKGDVWSVVDFQPDGQQLKLAGRYPNQVKGAFTIQKGSNTPRTYKLLFCPVGSPCKNIGISTDPEGKKRLVVSYQSDPLVVKFHRHEPE